MIQKTLLLLLYVSAMIGMSVAASAKQTGMETLNFADGRLVTITSIDDRFVSGTNHVMSFYWVEREGAQDVWRPVLIKWKVPKSQEFYVLTTDGSEIQIADWKMVRRGKSVILIGAHKELKDGQSSYDESPVRITYFSLEKGGDYEARRYFSEYKSVVTKKIYADAELALKAAAKGM